MTGYNNPADKLRRSQSQPFSLLIWWGKDSGRTIVYRNLIRIFFKTVEQCVQSIVQKLVEMKS